MPCGPKRISKCHRSGRLSGRQRVAVSQCASLCGAGGGLCVKTRQGTARAYTGRTAIFFEAYPKRCISDSYPEGHGGSQKIHRRHGHRKCQSGRGTGQKRFGNLVGKPRLQSIRSAALPMIAAILILSGAIIWGCGKKGPPVPPQRYRPEAVTDLSYELSNGRVKLRWTIPRQEDQQRVRIVGCTVYRAQRTLADADCIECRRSFQPAANIDVPPEATDRARRQQLGFDDNLTPGFEYAYRVVCSTAAGAAGKVSNVVRIEYPEPTTQQP